ncbi:MAG TPA: helix-turn-helix transcriptional regulator [Candidatus Paceibacterota bacterium]|nr:helix-turn-helix transcriptional regulator [Candidatus Paceibacterota bacterium]
MPERLGNHPLNSHFAKAIRRIRHEKGVSEFELGDRIKVPPKDIRSFESGGRTVSASYLYLIAHALEVPIERFFENIDPKIPLIGTRAIMRGEAQQEARST